MAAHSNGQAIIFLPCGFFFFYVSSFSSPNLSRCRLDVNHTSTHGVILVRIWDAGLKRVACGSLKIQDTKSRHLHTIAHFWAISLQLRHVLIIEKNLLNSDISPTCPHSMVNFGPLAAEIGSVVSLRTLSPR